MRILIALVAVAICAASATSPKQRTITTSTTVTASFSDTWTALDELFAARGWKLLTNERSGGFKETEWLPLTDTSHLDCGTAALGKDRQAKVHIAAHVKTEADGAITVTVDAKFERVRKFDDSAQIVTCTSKGTLEAQIFADLNSRLKILTVKKQKEAAEASRTPFLCTAARADPNTAWCARNETGCEAGRAEIQKTIGDATPCEKATKAVCLIGTNVEGVQVERCYPSPEMCAAQRKLVVGPPPQMTNVGECS